MYYGHLNHTDLRFYPQAIQVALNYLRTTDFSQLAPGRHEVEDGIWAVVLDLETKPVDQVPVERHQHTLDVQFCFRGCEKIGVSVYNPDAGFQTSANQYFAPAYNPESVGVSATGADGQFNPPHPANDLDSLQQSLGQTGALATAQALVSQVGGQAPVQVSQMHQPYQADRDIQFFADNNLGQLETFLPMLPGNFAVFYPQDLHRPACQLVDGQAAALRKVVVKVTLERLVRG